MPKFCGVFNPDGIQVIVHPTVTAMYKLSFTGTVFAVADVENFTRTIPLAKRFAFSFAVQTDGCFGERCRRGICGLLVRNLLRASAIQFGKGTVLPMLYDLTRVGGIFPSLVPHSKLALSLFSSKRKRLIHSFLIGFFHYSQPRGSLASERFYQNFFSGQSESGEIYTCARRGFALSPFIGIVNLLGTAVLLSFASLHDYQLPDMFNTGDLCCVLGEVHCILGH
jgi:hypothetical protein